MVRSAESASRTTQSRATKKARRIAAPGLVHSVPFRDQALTDEVSTFTPGPMVDESEMRLM
jgi:hypothetical protein